MGVYDHSKFIELSLERKVKVTLDLIYRIEEDWGDFRLRESRLETLRDYLKWSHFGESEYPLLAGLGIHRLSSDKEISLRGLLDFAVPMERFLGVSLKDDRILVRKGDLSQPMGRKFPLYFVLDHLRSSFNVGSIFRTAECLGVSHIYLVGYTPTPNDRGVQKTAMETEKAVSWSQHHHLEEVINRLRQQDIKLIALETVKESHSLQHYQFEKNVALLVGNERFGLQKRDLALADDCVEIPMMGQKNSLNVANSLSIVGFEVIRQWMS